MDLTKAKIWFVILSFAVFALFAISAVRESDREWKKWQKEFFALEQERGIERDYTVKIRQVWDPQRNVTDRCITCHVGMEDPDVANPYLANPFKSHPKVDMMKHHPTNQLGCTVCHQGQGAATSIPAAHGWVHHWDWPMFEQRGGISFTQASCTKCHAPDKLPEGTEAMLTGRAIWDLHGCQTCHLVARIQPDGGNQGPELTGLGSLTESEFSNKHSYEFVEAVSAHEHTTKYQWLYQHFLDPQKIVPDNPHTPDFDGTIMPNFRLTDTEAKLLTLFVESFREPAKENIPGQWIATSPGRYDITKPVKK
jgi:cytochrome c2